MAGFLESSMDNYKVQMQAIESLANSEEVTSDGMMSPDGKAEDNGSIGFLKSFSEYFTREREDTEGAKPVVDVPQAPTLRSTPTVTQSDIDTFTSETMLRYPAQTDKAPTKPLEFSDAPVTKQEVSEPEYQPEEKIGNARTEKRMGLMSQDTVDEETIAVGDNASSSIMEPPTKKVETQDAVEQLPPAIKESVEEAAPKSDKDVNAAIFDATNFSGEIATPSKGDDILTWIAQNTYGLQEDDPAFKKAFKALTRIDPQKTPWCGAFAGHVLRNVGVDLPSDAKKNPDLAFNYSNLGDEVYNHNPTTNETYAGSIDAVKPGDLIVFNKANRKRNGDFNWAFGHVAFVVGTEEDGSIIAVGGNQGGDARGGGAVTTSRYSPDIVKENYKGGFTVRRITNDSLEETDPSIIAALTKDIAQGGAGL
jgi:hypothetical protein